MKSTSLFWKPHYLRETPVAFNPNWVYSPARSVMKDLEAEAAGAIKKPIHPAIWLEYWYTRTSTLTCTHCGV